MKGAKAINEVLSAHPHVERAMLYGSRAKGTFRPGSDIDLTLAGAGLPLTERFQIELELDDLLLPYTMNVKPRTGPSPRRAGTRKCRECRMHRSGRLRGTSALNPAAGRPPLVYPSPGADKRLQFYPASAGSRPAPPRYVGTVLAC